MQDEDFVERVISRYRQLRRGVLSEERLLASRRVSPVAGSGRWRSRGLSCSGSKLQPQTAKFRSTAPPSHASISFS